MTDLSALSAVCGQRILTDSGFREGALLIRDGRIEAIVPIQDVPAGIPTENCGDLVIMPGLIDTHVHINEPGRTDWEGFETATKAAAAGGFTTLIDMPLNSSPVTTTTEALKKKVQAAEKQIYVDCGFYGGLIPGHIDHLPGLIDSGVCGVKAFLIHSGIDEFPNVTGLDLRLAMPIIAKSGLPLLVHAELASELPSSGDYSNPKSYEDYLASRPRRWENDAVEMMIGLSREYGCKTHIVHLVSSDAVPTLKEARANGLPISVETCPHYLFFHSENIPNGDTRFKCAPPIREADNREKLWQALKEGIIDFIVSDHSPCPPQMKLLETGDFQKAWGGISSLQFGLSIVWTEAHKRGFTIHDLWCWMSKNPAQFLGLADKKGKIAPGFDGDLAVWDPKATITVSKNSNFHRHKLTPYEGHSLFGAVKKTFLRGKKVFDDGIFVNQPFGKVLRKV